MEETELKTLADAHGGTIVTILTYRREPLTNDDSYVVLLRANDDEEVEAHRRPGYRLDGRTFALLADDISLPYGEELQPQ